MQTIDDMPILPCPFCGGEDMGFDHTTDSSSVCVWCTNCGALGGPSETEAGAVAQWNRRPEVSKIL